MANAKSNPTPIALEQLVSLEGLTTFLNTSRRTVERLKASGKLPKPDIRLGRMPRWRPETLLGWLEDNAARL
jgi:predicted DNA-binding transcriptional regulator AlpA